VIFVVYQHHHLSSMVAEVIFPKLIHDCELVFATGACSSAAAAAAVVVQTCGRVL
jgi:hypothetical protein